MTKDEIKRRGEMGEKIYNITVKENVGFDEGLQRDKWKAITTIDITEAEFLDRINHVRSPEFLTSQQAIGIMLHGCKEKRHGKKVCDTGME